MLKSVTMVALAIHALGAAPEAEALATPASGTSPAGEVGETGTQAAPPQQPVIRDLGGGKYEVGQVRIDQKTPPD